MYTEYQPSPILAPYIDNYWEFKGNPEYGMRIPYIAGMGVQILYLRLERLPALLRKTYKLYNLIVLSLWDR